jgi:hypothetical protein
MQRHRKVEFWILLLVLVGPCVAALIWVQMLNDPARRVRSTGAAYSPNYKSGKWVRAESGMHFDDRQLAIIVKAMKEFREPHSLTLTGETLTDQGFSAFADASNIYAIGLVGLNVSDVALTHLDSLAGLEYLAIQDCPNISDEGLQAFQHANPAIQVVRHSMEGH